MAYTPPTAPPAYDKIQAPGLVQIKDNEVLVMLFEPEKDVKKFRISRDKCPSYVKKSRSKDDYWMLDVAANGSRMNSQRPMDGMFDVRVKEFAHRNNADPQIRINQQYGSKSFVVILEILSGYEKGMTIPFILPFFFAPVEEMVNDQKFTVVGWENHPKSSKMPILQDWAKYTGLFERGPIKWSDNVLPVFAKRVADNNRGFRVVLKDGWVTSLMSFINKPTPQDFEPDVEE